MQISQYIKRINELKIENSKQRKQTKMSKYTLLNEIMAKSSMEKKS